MMDGFRLEPRPEALFFLLTSGWIPACLHAVAHLGVARILAEGPRSAQALAEALEAHPQALERVMRALSTVGIFERDRDGCYRLGALGHWMRPDVPGSMHAAVLAYNAPWRQSAWGALLHSVRTGGPAFDHAMGMALFEYLARDGEAARVFDEGQTSAVALTGAAVVASYDFAGRRCVVDVAGGQGRLLSAVLKANPHLEGVLFDLPHVIDQARSTDLPAREGLAGRVRYVGGDALEALPPGGDVYLFQRIIHGFNDEGALRILRNCHRAAAPDGRILLIEAVVRPESADPVGVFFDLEMLVVAGGRTRGLEEFRALFDAAGFELTRLIPTGTPFSIVEGVRR